MYDSGVETETTKPLPQAAGVGEIRTKTANSRQVAGIGIAALMVQLLLALILGPLVGLPLWIAHTVGFAAGVFFAVREYMTRDVPRSPNTCDQLEAMGRFIFIVPVGLALGLAALLVPATTLHVVALQTLAMLVSAGFTYIAARLWVT